MLEEVAGLSIDLEGPVLVQVVNVEPVHDSTVLQTPTTDYVDVSLKDPVANCRVRREAANAILAHERPRDARVADEYPTEFSAGVAQRVGAEGQLAPFFQHRSEDDLAVGEIGGTFVNDEGTIEIGYAVVESRWRTPSEYVTRTAGVLQDVDRVVLAKRHTQGALPRPRRQRAGLRPRVA